MVEQRAGRPSSTPPPDTGARARALDGDAAEWVPGKELPDAVLDSVGLPQAVSKPQDPLASLGPGASSPPANPSQRPRRISLPPADPESGGATPSSPPADPSQRPRRISLPPADPATSGTTEVRAIAESAPAAEVRPVAEAVRTFGAPGTSKRRLPGQFIAAEAESSPTTERAVLPLADARGLESLRAEISLPVLGRFGPYEILGRLAMGGMAEILLARREGSDQPVVVKKILAQYARDEDFVGMFLDEARIGSSLDHPNICRFLDFGEVDRQLFIAMEWVHGVTLGRLIRRARDAGGLAPAMACEIVAKVADALHYAHTARDAEGQVMGLIHRDVSPHNIMVGFDGVVKLLDFGIAKAEVQSHQTQAGVVKGKFAYMAPEQCRGGAIDFRIDIFSLGVVLFEALTGKSLYRRSNEAATMHAIVVEEVPSLIERMPSAPRELDAIVRTSLQKEPAARFPTAAAMRDVLAHFVTRSAEGEGGVSEAHIAAVVQNLFRDDLEIGPTVDSTPFGASYELDRKSVV